MTDPNGKDMELAERVARRIANSKYKTWDRIMGFLDCLILELRAEKEAAVKEAEIQAQLWKDCATASAQLINSDHKTCVKQARAEGKQDGLNKALEIIRFICKNDCEVYMCVFDTIKKAREGK